MVPTKKIALQTKFTVGGPVSFKFQVSGFPCEIPPSNFNNSKINCKIKTPILLAANKITEIAKALDWEGFMCYICGRDLHLMVKKKKHTKLKKNFVVLQHHFSVCCLTNLAWSEFVA